MYLWPNTGFARMRTLAHAHALKDVFVLHKFLSFDIKSDDVTNGTRPHRRFGAVEASMGIKQNCKQLPTPAPYEKRQNNRKQFLPSSRDEEGTEFFSPRNVSRSLRSMAEPRLSIKSRLENPPLLQYSDKNLCNGKIKQCLGKNDFDMNRAP